MIIVIIIIVVVVVLIVVFCCLNAHIFSCNFFLDMQDKKILGVSCSTNNAKEYNLQRVPAGQQYKYRCTCRGQSSLFVASPMWCKVHYWECPLTTQVRMSHAGVSSMKHFSYHSRRLEASNGPLERRTGGGEQSKLP